jgi:hypothetical protein
MSNDASQLHGIIMLLVRQHAQAAWHLDIPLPECGAMTGMTCQLWH